MADVTLPSACLVSVIFSRFSAVIEDICLGYYYIRAAHMDSFSVLASWSLRLSQSSLGILFLPLSTFVVRGVYNRYFHPLKDFPGPFWSSVTDLYKLYVLSSHDVTTFSLELHEKYGEDKGSSPRDGNCAE